MIKKPLHTYPVRTDGTGTLMPMVSECEARQSSL